MRSEAGPEREGTDPPQDPTTPARTSPSGRAGPTPVAHLDDPKRFRNGRQVGAYGGLVPRQFQSGEDDRWGRITRWGPAVLRKLLVQCAWCMLRYNRWARAVFDRLIRGKARRKQAVVALARRVLRDTPGQPAVAGRPRAGGDGRRLTAAAP